MADDPKDPPDPKPDPDPDDGLGDKGKKALEAERKARRDAEKKAQDLETRLKELEDKDKSDGERLADKLAAAEKRATDAEAKALRYEVAAEKGVKPRWLAGTTREELEAAADEYLTDHPPADPGDPGGNPPPRKPVEDLKGGGDPSAEPTETNPTKLAELVPRL